MTAEDAKKFLVACLVEAEADGYQQMADAADEDEELRVPDDWSHDDNTITLVFDGEEFCVTVKKRRKKGNVT